jgi:hypothetical protein
MIEDNLYWTLFSWKEIIEILIKYLYQSIITFLMNDVLIRKFAHYIVYKI